MWQSWLQIGKPANDEGDRKRDRDREGREGGEGGRDAMKLVKKLTAPRKIIHSLHWQRFLNALRHLVLFLPRKRWILLSFIDYFYFNTTIYYSIYYALLYILLYCYKLFFCHQKGKYCCHLSIIYRQKYAWICLVFKPIAWLSQLNHYAQLKLEVLALKCWWPIDCWEGICRGRCLCFQSILS